MCPCEVTAVEKYRHRDDDDGDGDGKELLTKTEEGMLI
jgi:hypothetical protein